MNYGLKKLPSSDQWKLEEESGGDRRQKYSGKMYVKSSQEEDGGDPAYKIKPSLVANLFGDWIMPLTNKQGSGSILVAKIGLGGASCFFTRCMNVSPLDTNIK